jgi:bacteriophage N4 adsorption protein B
VTGIALQSWERNGWKGSLPVVYWFWRDRKGLIGSPVSLVSNWILAYGAATWCWSAVQGPSWGLEQALRGPFAPVLLWSTLFLNIWRTGVRMWCVSRIYGWAFASLVPDPSALWSNCINALATCSAVKRFLKAKIRHEPLVWLKTEHAYPNRGCPAGGKAPLGRHSGRQRVSGTSPDGSGPGAASVLECRWASFWCAKGCFRRAIFTKP